MLRVLRRCSIPLAGAALALGSLAVSGTAASAATTPQGAQHMSAAHLIRPAAHLIRPGSHGTRPRGALGTRANQAYSTNWSGFAAHGGTYTSVSANWVEPAGTCPGGDQYSSFWVGLDGYNSNTVEQTGSEVDCVGTTPVYYSWYEMYPAYPVNFSNTVKPGDHFSGSVTYNGGSSYTLVLTDHTQGWSHTVNASLSGAANSSAEAIAEAPCCTASGGILPLTDFGTMSFSGAAVDGSPIGDFSPTQIIMVNNSGQPKDSVSSLSSGGNFSVTWLRSR